MDLKLFNTASRSIESLVIDPKKTLKIYGCGPTVYGAAHIGNFRTYVVQDTVLRLLQLLKLPYCYVRNITDVDDKTIRNSIAQGKTLSEYTQYWTEIFHRDCRRLGLLSPTIEPRATETIAAQQELIQTLLQKGHAYVRKGSVYFRIASFPSYGKLSRVHARMLQTQGINSAGQSNDADEYDREQIADFVLWKAYKQTDGHIAWESPWGKGRPGWHLECSTMAHLYLGQTVDLHIGGVDLCFPHHENEIAQSEAAYGAPFVRHWMHIAHLQVEGQKMSKSLGNLFTLDDLQTKGYDAATVRYALLAGHYQQTLNFSFDLLRAAQCALQKIHAYTHRLLQTVSVPEEAFCALISRAILPSKCVFLSDFFEALLEDVNTPKALGCLFSFLHKHPSPPSEPTSFLNEWAAALYALGISLEGHKKEPIKIPHEVQQLAQQRWEAKQARDFSKADQLRQILQQKGWEVFDQKEDFYLKPTSQTFNQSLR